MLSVDQAPWALFQTLSQAIEKQTDGVRAALALAMEILREHEALAKAAAQARTWHLVDSQPLNDWVPVHRPHTEPLPFTAVPIN